MTGRKRSLTILDIFNFSMWFNFSVPNLTKNKTVCIKKGGGENENNDRKKYKSIGLKKKIQLFFNFKMMRYILLLLAACCTIVESNVFEIVIQKYEALSYREIVDMENSVYKFRYSFRVSLNLIQIIIASVSVRRKVEDHMRITTASVKWAYREKLPWNQLRRRSTLQVVSTIRKMINVFLQDSNPSFFIRFDIYSQW